MTIPAGDDPRKSYAGNGSTVNFTTPIFINNSGIKAILVTDATGAEAPQTEITHYTLTGGGGAAGTLTMITAPPTGTTLVIYVDEAISQQADPVNGDPLDVDVSIETPDDKLTLIARRTTDLIERALRLPEGDTGFVAADMYLPAKVDRLGKYLFFDLTTGKPTATSGTTALPGISTFGETLIDDADAATARATLGLNPLDIPDAINDFRLIKSGANLTLERVTGSYININGTLRKISGALPTLAASGFTTGTITNVDKTVVPPVVTETAHGRNNGDMVSIGGVGGCTSANGIWEVANTTANTYELKAANISAGPAYTSGGVATTVLYYIYAYWTGSAVALEHSSTGYTIGASGRAEKTGDTSRRLVGMAAVYGDATGLIWQDDNFARLVASYNHRRAKHMSMIRLTQLHVTITTLEQHAELQTERGHFVTWADESFWFIATLSFWVTIGSGQIEVTLDNDNAMSGQAIGTPSNNPQYVNTTTTPDKVTLHLHNSLAEGYHYAHLSARQNATTSTTDDLYLSGMVTG